MPWHPQGRLQIKAFASKEIRPHFPHNTDSISRVDCEPDMLMKRDVYEALSSILYERTWDFPLCLYYLEIVLFFGVIYEDLWHVEIYFRAWAKINGYVVFFLCFFFFGIWYLEWATTPHIKEKNELTLFIYSFYFSFFLFSQVSESCVHSSSNYLTKISYVILTLSFVL